MLPRELGLEAGGSRWGVGEAGGGSFKADLVPEGDQEPIGKLRLIANVTQSSHRNHQAASKALHPRSIVMGMLWYSYMFPFSLSPFPLGPRAIPRQWPITHPPKNPQKLRPQIGDRDTC